MSKVPYKPGPKSSKNSQIIFERGSLGESSTNTEDSSSYESDVNSKVPRTPERRRKTKRLVGIENLSEFQIPEMENDVTDYGLEFTTSHIQTSPRRCSTFRKTGQSSQEENQEKQIGVRANAKKSNKENYPNSGTSKQRHNIKETTTSAKAASAATQKVAGQTRRKQRNPVQLEKRFWNEVKALQNRTDFLIPLLPFSRLVRQLIQSASTEVTKITPAALEALQASSELYLTQRLQDAYMLTLHRGRVTLDAKDMKLINFLKIN